jgi:hypothetical protein
MKGPQATKRPRCPILGHYPNLGKSICRWKRFGLPIVSIRVSP